MSGNRLLDGSNNRVVLHGVDRSGSEYACEQGYGIFDGTGTNDDSQPPDIASWNVNSEFVGLNEDCWLGINGVPGAYGGASYQAAIEHYVKTIEANHMYPVIGLFWEAPGNTRATGQDPMADNDHAPVFWEEVATAFKNDPNVIFRLEEEPFPSGPAGALASWQCWSQGDVSYSTASVNTPPTPPTPTGKPGKCAGMVTDQEGGGAPYQAVGMQSMVNIIRGVGATNVIQIPGTWYANSMTCSSDGSPYTCGFLDTTHGIRVSDPLLQPQLMADVDVYPDVNGCGDTACYDTTYAPIAQVMPLDAGETSPDGHPNTKEDQFLAWMDQHQGSYYAWAWDTWAGLISSYATATPASPWGTDYYNRINAIVPPPAAQPTDGITFRQAAQAPCINTGGGAVTFTRPVSSGDDLFLVVGGQGYTGPASYVTSVSDNVNGAWTQLANPGTQRAGTGPANVSYAVYELQNSNAAASGLTITVRGVSGQSGMSGVAVDVGGVSAITSAAFDSTVQPTSETYNSPALSSVPANDVILGLYGSYAPQSFSTSTGWNISSDYWITDSLCGAAALDWSQPSTSGSVTATITANGSENHYGGALDLHP